MQAELIDIRNHLVQHSPFDEMPEELINQLTESIETLSQSFSSSGLIDRLVELDPEQGRAQLSSLVRVARANPVPFLLIGERMRYSLIPDEF